MHRFFLRLGSGVLGALALLSATTPVVAQQAPPQQYLDRLPPLIDRELFFGDPEISAAQLSPDGRFITFRRPYKGVINIWVKGIGEPFDAARPLTADTARPVRGYFWSQDSRYVLYVQDKGGNENFHVYAVNPAAQPERATGVPPALDLTPYENVQARIYAVPEATPDQIIVGINDRDQKVHDVYRLDLKSGQRQLVIQNDENLAGWLTDLDGTVRLGVRVASDGSTRILRVEGDAFTEVYACSNEEICGPIRFHKDGRRVYMLTNKGADIDLARLILFDPATETEEFVESDPENQVDFGGAVFSDKTDELVATYYVGDRLRIYPKTDQVARDLAVLREKLPDGEIYPGSSTEDEELTLVSVTRDVDPGSTYLYTRATGAVELLYRSRPALPVAHLAPMQAIRYRARDGLEIPAYLTVPNGVEPANLPVVIHPHGGPWSRDRWGYDPYTQYLANRGYAVLQPNFRGSTGYGKAFLNAGNEEWGTGAMQHDITDAVAYLIEQGIADPERVAIFGGSYGGYATLAGVAFTPQVYAAGISYVGPSSLITLLKSIPPYWEPIKKIFHVRVGDPDDPEDRVRLEAQSPLHAAERITAPLLVIQGANDPRVKKAESERIVIALRDLGREVEYLLAADEGHGFAGRENRLVLAAAIERFFAKHLGGRYQEDMPEDIAARMASLTVDVTTVELAEAPSGAAEAATAPLPATDGKSIRAAALEYNFTMAVSGREMAMAMTRSIAATTAEGQALWLVVDAAQTPGGVVADSMWVDRQTLEPVRRRTGGGATITLSYSDTAITGEMDVGGQTTPIEVALDAPVFGEGPGMELALAGLPLAEGYRATFRVFDALMRRVRPMQLVITGTERTECAAGSFDTFVVELTPLDGDEAGRGTLRVMQAAPHHVVRSSYRMPAMAGGGTASLELTSVAPAGTR